MYFLVYPQSFVDYTTEYKQAFLYAQNYVIGVKHIVITDKTFSKNAYLYFLFYTKNSSQGEIQQSDMYPNPLEKDTKKKYIFIPNSPSRYDLNTLYIEQTKETTPGATILFTTNATEKDNRISISKVLE